MSKAQFVEILECAYNVRKPSNHELIQLAASWYDHERGRAEAEIERLESPSE